MKVLETSKTYHANPAIGSTLLKKIAAKTVKHALTEKLSQSTSMVIGSALHNILLDPESFDSNFIVSPDFNRRTKEGRDAFAKFEEAASGKTIITEEQLLTVRAMSREVQNHLIAKNMLRGGEAEYSYYAEIEGISVKCRPDYIFGDCIIDVKTTIDASFEAFAKQMGNLNYLIQAAFYIDVYNLSQNKNIQEFYFIAVENTEPHGVAVYFVDQMQLEAGRAMYRKALRKYKDYLELKKELGDEALNCFSYPQEIINIQVPYWFLDKIEA